jgi:hypothetical protein
MAMRVSLVDGTEPPEKLRASTSNLWTDVEYETRRVMAAPSRRSLAITRALLTLRSMAAGARE